ncbi:MAG: molybdenum ABC transporter ATP-binding protein [Pirellulaceae bacterium]
MNLNFQCRHRYADGFELDVEFTTDHDCTVIFGPSGSGKTSILSIIAGTVLPDSGRIALGDHILLDRGQDICLRPERRGVGYVFQEPLLFPHQTVAANLEFGKRYRAEQSRDIDIDRVAEVLEIGDLMTRMPDTLSGGQRQRVALGRDVASGPDLLLMDEPIASLDEGLKLKILAWLERVIDEWEVPVLYVTHSHAEVSRLGRHVLLIESGRVIAGGEPLEILSRVESLGQLDLKAPLNLLRIDKLTEESDATYAWIGDSRLMVSPQTTKSPSREFIQFAPADVLVSREVVGGTSARNALQGTIRDIVPVGSSRLVAIDIGQIVWAALTQQAADELNLAIDLPVRCLIKAHNVRLIN